MWQEIPPLGRNSCHVVRKPTTLLGFFPCGGISCHMVRFLTTPLSWPWCSGEDLCLQICLKDIATSGRTTLSWSALWPFFFSNRCAISLKQRKCMNDPHHSAFYCARPALLKVLGSLLYRLKVAQQTWKANIISCCRYPKWRTKQCFQTKNLILMN